MKYRVSKDIKNNINTLPCLGRIISTGAGDRLLIKDIVYSLDCKEVYCFISYDKETYKVPEGIVKINNHAFLPMLKKVTIPTSVEKMGDNVFSKCDLLEVVQYLGTREMWDAKFQNVQLRNATLICKKK